MVQNGAGGDLDKTRYNFNIYFLLKRPLQGKEPLGLGDRDGVLFPRDRLLLSLPDISGSVNRPSH